MYAIIQTGGKQYRVTPGDILEIEKLSNTVGENIKLDQVLLVGGRDNKEVLVGRPFVAQASVEAEIVQQTRDDKIFIVKYKRRKGHRKTQGHRQSITRLLITKLADGQGGVAQFDSAQRKEALMRASIPSSTRQKEAAAPAVAKVVKVTKKTEAAPKKAPKKAASKK